MPELRDSRFTELDKAISKDTDYSEYNSEILEPEVTNKEKEELKTIRNMLYYLCKNNNICVACKKKFATKGRVRCDFCSARNVHNSARSHMKRKNERS